MAHAVIPRTIDELLVDYDRFITGCIYKVSRGHVRTEDIDDLRQAVLTRIHEKHYLDKYDPAKGSFSSYLFWLIRSVVCNAFDANTRNPLNSALRIRSRRHREGPGTIVLDTFRAAQDESFERVEMAKLLADQFEAHLSRVPAHRRKLLPVFALLRQTFEPKEIAVSLGVSRSAVSAYMKRLRVEARAFLDAQGVFDEMGGVDTGAGYAAMASSAHA